MDDVVTEVEGQPTASVTHSQLLDAIGRQTGDIERNAKGPLPQRPEVEQRDDQLRNYSLKNCDPLNDVTGPQGRPTMLPTVSASFSKSISDHPIINSLASSSSTPPFATNAPETTTEGLYTALGSQRQEPAYSSREPANSPKEPPYSIKESAYSPKTTPYEFQTVQSRPFVEPANRRKHRHPASQPVTVPQTRSQLDSEAGFEQMPVGYDSSDEYSNQMRNNVSEVPQSRTFRILESIMSNEEPAAGASGLPPPRSAAMEKMKREGSRGAGSSPRVKVLMSQKYNSPLGMYSAKNVIETFAVQAETALETLDQ